MEQPTTLRRTLSQGRKIAAILHRNSRGDANSGKIDYKGFHFSFDDGSPAEVAFNRICTIGVRTIFGRHLPAGESFLVQFFLIPLEDPCAPRPTVPKHVKPRRIYLERRGPKVILHLPDGTPTDIVFCDDDDPRVLQWTGQRDIAEGQRQWYDVVAICNGDTSGNGKPQGDGADHHVAREPVRFRPRHPR